LRRGDKTVGKLNLTWELEMPKRPKRNFEILREKARIEQQHGPWTAHNVWLAEDIFTLPGPPDWAYLRGKWFSHLGEVLLGRPLKGMRVLDIGCLEGGIAMAIGESGAEVVGIDVREANLAKARFARDVRGLRNVEFVEANMLKLEDYDLGKFDIVVCAGTLYHVDAPNILSFLSGLRRVCSGLVMIDTHFATEAREEYVGENGRSYLGRTFVETHYRERDIEEKKKDRWGSLDNNLAFWLTERSLINMLIDAGFPFVVQPVVPVMEWPWHDRGFWVAYPSVSGVPFPPGRMEDPSNRAPYHPMLDSPVQQNSRNPATRRLGYDG
jgi:2-polyprenyl-3-methyl-5-hydroxy-6-metoxy-1,4-benzoquinol methylase